MAQTQQARLPGVLRVLDEHRAARHALFWLADTAFGTWVFVALHHQTPEVSLALRDALLIVVCTHLPATYALLYGVLPALGPDAPRRGRFLALLGGWLVLSVALNYAFRYLLLVPLHEGVTSPFPDFHVVLATGSNMPTLLMAGLAACLHVYRQWRQKEQANLALSGENYQAELQLLKAQIHPHFLFNTLNNLYALTLKQSDEAPAVVERLTGLLHFVVEQGDAASVALSEEVTLLRNYMALEQLRYGRRLTLTFEAPDVPPTARIAPLLLLPLVENAFKHGPAEQVGPARIHIELTVVDRQFSCLITNTKHSEAAEGHTPGIGLRNVRQRLQLLYPQRHHLRVAATPDTFTVHLQLELPELRPTAVSPQPAPAAAVTNREEEPARATVSAQPA